MLNVVWTLLLLQIKFTRKHRICLNVCTKLVWQDININLYNKIHLYNIFIIHNVDT